MCGIVGYITVKNDTLEFAKDKFFTEALYMNALRGRHSTGVMSVSGDFHWAWGKQAVSAAEYIDKKDWSKRETKTWCAVGHGRHATVGDITTDNAHPFQHDSIILVHNGTLRSTYQMDHKNKDIVVDSELIAYNLSKVEPDKAADVIGNLIGAYALVWFDDRDQSVNMVRNNERPLHLGINKAEDALYFMSDGYMLNAIGRRFSNEAVGPQRIWQMGPHQLLKYKKGNLVPEVTEVSPFTYKAPTTRFHRTRDNTSRRVGGTSLIGKKSTVHEEMVKDWYMVNPEEEYFFEPKGHINWGNKEGLITGLMWHPEWATYLDVIVPCDMLHKSPAEMLLEYEGPWSITIRGVSHMPYTEEAKELTFIGKVKWYTWPQNRPLPEEEGMGTEDNDRVQGPHGEIDIPAFNKLVEEGCTMCAMPVLPEDADEVTWVGELANQPCCAKCIAWFTS